MRTKLSHRFCFVSALLMVLVTPNVNASQATLEQFFDQVKTLQSNFEQKVVDETGMLLEFSKGRLSLSRPGKFRWDYQNLEALAQNDQAGSQAIGQQIVADGESIFMYDPDLEQVTQRSMANAMAQVPSLLLVDNATNIDQHFTVSDIGVTDGLSWVALKPKSEDAGYQQLMIGFAKQSIIINSIVLLDGLGNETRLTLSEVQINTEIDSDVFSFEVPAGADLLSE